jgi:hypothetical protein
MSVLFVDESKSKGYTMVAAVVAPSDMATLRRDVRSLVLPGQRRIHFTKENDQRKRAILSALTSFGVEAHIVQSNATRDAVGREDCLVRLVSLAAVHDHERMVLERDDSVQQADRRILYREVENHGLRGRLTYEHEQAHQEPLLWIADAIAWGYTKGGDWRRRVQPLTRVDAPLLKNAKLGSPTVRKAAELTSRR